MLFWSIIQIPMNTLKLVLWGISKLYPFKENIII